jgi:hypothetical protein
MGELDPLLEQARDALDEVGQAISDLMAGIDSVGSARVLDGVRACMTSINELYKRVDLLRIQTETDIIERSSEYIEIYQKRMEEMFRTYSQGGHVTNDMVQAFALAWMDFRSSQNDLLEYIEKHPDLAV